MRASRSIQSFCRKSAMQKPARREATRCWAFWFGGFAMSLLELTRNSRNNLGVLSSHSYLGRRSKPRLHRTLRSAGGPPLALRYQLAGIGVSRDNLRTSNVEAKALKSFLNWSFE
jgi:hypothetical protein